MTATRPASQPRFASARRWGLALLGALAWIGITGAVAPAQTSSSDDTFSDRMIINRMLQEQLESATSHQPVEWHNPKTGHRGQIVVFPAVARDNTYCRPYEFTWDIGSRIARYRGIPCRDARGMWRNPNETRLADEKFVIPLPDGATASFNCRRATRLDEKLVCSDVSTAAVDAEMGRRLDSLGGVTAPADHADLAREQSDWAVQRNRQCGFTETSEIANRAHWQRTVDCLTTEIRHRIIVLRARHVDAQVRLSAVAAEARAAAETRAAADATRAAAERRELITRVQRNLRRLAYFQSAATGELDGRLEAAIQEFERDDGLQVSGKPSPIVAERSQRVIARMTQVAGCSVARESAQTQRICGRVGPN